MHSILLFAKEINHFAAFHFIISIKSSLYKFFCSLNKGRKEMPKILTLPRFPCFRSSQTHLLTLLPCQIGYPFALALNLTNKPF